MRPSSSDSNPGTNQSRIKLIRATKLHWFHWMVVVGSLVLTFFVWNTAKQHLNERVQKQFERESQQTIAHIEERMQKYEDALWGGVALFETLDGKVTHEQWLDYASSISIEEKYPGINGIGFIYRVRAEDLAEFEADQRKHQPEFKAHPEHDKPFAYPITYIEPLETNLAARGLDMAHEHNRYTAAEKARTTKTSQITGPIVLVQDSNHTPGFLFYAPYYNHDSCQEGTHRDDCMKGMVYAPFVMRNLMRGTLSESSRHINIRLIDDGTTLFDELTESNADFDPDPLLTQAYSLDMYGRTWELEIHTDHSFRNAQQSSQPKLILAGGILIDSMIFMLFVLLAKANKQALRYADQMNENLEEKNGELEQYVYSASHDLKSPLFSIQGYAHLLKECVEDEDYESIPEFVENISRGTDRMRQNIESLLEVSKAGTTSPELEQAMVAEIIEHAIEHMDDIGVLPRSSITLEGDAPVMIDRVRFNQVFENLFSNSAKYADPARPVRVKIQVLDLDDSHACIRFSDNGIGIEEQYRDKVFELFQRLSNDSGGNGVGLSIVKRVIESFHGKIWIEDSELGGIAVCMSIPKAQRSFARHAAA